MRTMTKERKKEGPRLGHKGRADAKASRQLLLLCIPAINRDDCMKLCKRHMRCRMCLSYRL